MLHNRVGSGGALRSAVVSRDRCMAQTSSAITFGPYRLDVSAAKLFRGDQAIALQPRPFAVLSYLAARPGLVVGREELITELWGGTHVTKAVLKVAVRAIREALDDAAGTPRYIETVGREGYRFIGAGIAMPPPQAAAPSRAAAAPAAAPTMVGRAQALATLQAGLGRAVAGARTIVFVSGEAGIGKTTLLDRFVSDIDPSGGIRVARGQCLEQYGEGEAYLPILEALGRLARDDDGGEVRDTLRHHAPTWVSQLAALAPASKPRRRRESPGAAPMPARMLREMADALEILTRDRPLVLVLEDLQWSDPSTVDLLAALARRRHPARLLVIGSLRPIERSAEESPLRGVQHDLQVKGLCDVVALEFLTRDDVAAYLERRFSGIPSAALARLAARVHAHTEGNALFMVNMLNDLVAGGMLAWRDGQWRIDPAIDAATDRLPTGLQELIGRGLHELDAPLRGVLEAASVVGDEFAVTAVAAALQADESAVEDACAQLASQGPFIVDTGIAEWPDGSVSGRYRFRHALYRRALYEGTVAARRVALHARIGRREEAGFGSRAPEHAAELAMHFSRGCLYPRALRFHELAAASALDRHAASEAVLHLGAALEALAHTPEGEERARRELDLAATRATLLMANQGYAAAETERAFARAHALCAAQPYGAQHDPVLRGLVSFHQVRAELDTARQLGLQLLHHAKERTDDNLLRVQAHYGQGTTLFHLGVLAGAQAHLETALQAYDAAAHRQHIRVYGGYDPGVACSFWLAWTLTLRGELDAAAQLERDGLQLAERQGDLFTLAYAHQAASVVRQLHSDWPASATSAAESIRLAEEHGFPYMLATATVSYGWALIMQGQMQDGIAHLRDGVAQVERTGAALVRPSYLGMLAAVDVMEGNPAQAPARLDEGIALAHQTGERVHEVALLVAKSQMLAAMGGRERRSTTASAAEECLHRAVEVAREQGARLFELRASVALARHLRERERAREARTLLSAAHAWFADHTPVAPEIVVARRLLEEMAP
jgi:DNA-binding winged helix-turn-helix (wHTH) protein/tetratricopeptide (TPR) repeat protein